MLGLKLIANLLKININKFIAAGLLSEHVKNPSKQKISLRGILQKSSAFLKFFPLQQVLPHVFSV